MVCFKNQIGSNDSIDSTDSSDEETASIFDQSQFIDETTKIDLHDLHSVLIEIFQNLKSKFQQKNIKTLYQ